MPSCSVQPVWGSPIPVVAVAVRNKRPFLSNSLVSPYRFKTRNNGPVPAVRSVLNVIRIDVLDEASGRSEKPRSSPANVIQSSLTCFAGINDRFATITSFWPSPVWICTAGALCDSAPNRKRQLAKPSTTPSDLVRSHITVQRPRRTPVLLTSVPTDSFGLIY